MFATGIASAENLDVDTNADLEEAELTLAKEAALGEGAEFVLDGRLWVRWPVLVGDGPGACVGWDGRLVEEETAVEVIRAEGENFEVAYTRWHLDHPSEGPAPDCPGSEPPDPLLDIVAHVREYMPPVQPTVQPPRNALAGVPVHLQLGRPVEVAPPPTTLPILGVDVTFQASPTTEIDWGDEHATDDNPRVTTHTDTAGVPWSERDEPGAVPITHYYTHTGDWTVTITDTWTVEATVSGFPEPWVLSVPMPPTTVPIPVGEIQAVVTDDS